MMKFEKKNKNILFIQPAYAHYREELFKLLSKQHKIMFVFEKKRSVYPGLNMPNGIEFKCIEKKFNKIHLGLVYILFKHNNYFIIMFLF